jgi:site-specific recombinase XerD
VQNKSRRKAEHVVERELIPAWRSWRRAHACLHRLFNWALRRGTIEPNPAADLPKRGNGRKRDRVLSDDELNGFGVETPTASDIDPELVATSSGWNVEGSMVHAPSDQSPR